MIYYNQYDYEWVPYPSPSLPNATIESGGCGVVCASMIVENMTGISMPPPGMAKFAMSVGARVDGGTDMNKLARAIGEKYGLFFTIATDEKSLWSHLANGGWGVANVGGDRGNYKGVFSSSGHFIVAAGVKNGKVVVLDPGYYQGKFNKTGRAGKVAVVGNECLCDLDVLGADTANRIPAYWLFAKEGEEVTIDEFKNLYKEMISESHGDEPSEWAEEACQKAQEAGIFSGDGAGNYDWQEPVTREALAIILYKAGIIK